MARPTGPDPQDVRGGRERKMMNSREENRSVNQAAETAFAMSIEECTQMRKEYEERADLRETATSQALTEAVEDRQGVRRRQGSVGKRVTYLADNLVEISGGSTEGIGTERYQIGYGRHGDRGHGAGAHSK